MSARAKSQGNGMVELEASPMSALDVMKDEVGRRHNHETLWQSPQR